MCTTNNLTFVLYYTLRKILFIINIGINCINTKRCKPAIQTHVKLRIRKTGKKLMYKV